MNDQFGSLLEIRLYRVYRESAVLDSGAMTRVHIPLLGSLR